MNVLLASQEVLCFMELVCVCVCMRIHAQTCSHMHRLVMVVGKIMQYSVCVQHFWWSLPNSKYVSTSPFISVGYHRSKLLPADSCWSCTKRAISEHVWCSHIRLWN